MLRDLYDYKLPSLPGSVNMASGFALDLYRQLADQAETSLAIVIGSKTLISPSLIIIIIRSLERQKSNVQQSIRSTVFFK